LKLSWPYGIGFSYWWVVRQLQGPDPDEKVSRGFTAALVPLTRRVACRFAGQRWSSASTGRKVRQDSFEGRGGIAKYPGNTIRIRYNDATLRKPVPVSTAVGEANDLDQPLPCPPFPTNPAYPDQPHPLPPHRSHFGAGGTTIGDHVAARLRKAGAGTF